AGGTPAVLEVPDGTGGLRLVLRAPPAAQSVLCDERGKPLGTLVESRDPRTLLLKNPAGDVEAQVAARPHDDPLLTFPNGSLRLHDENGLLRILDANGVPLGQIGRVPDKAVVYTPGGQGRATVERVEPGDERRA